MRSPRLFRHSEIMLSFLDPHFIMSRYFVMYFYPLKCLSVAIILYKLRKLPHGNFLAQFASKIAFTISSHVSHKYISLNDIYNFKTNTCKFLQHTPHMPTGLFSLSLLNFVIVTSTQKEISFDGQAHRNN